jgi:hypothetical protein
MRLRALPILGCLALVCAPARGALIVDRDPSWCGTTRTGLVEALAIHQDHARRMARPGRLTAALSTAPQAERVGNVAVLVDDGSMVAQPNAFDLDQFGLVFTARKKGETIAPSAEPLIEEIGGRIEIGDDESRLVSFPKGFKFTFFGRAYTKVFLNSDGNLTFQAAESSSSERSLGRFLGGPPRIAAAFTDLDATQAPADGGVYLSVSKSRVVVTWLRVPEFGKRNQNTFQIALYSGGRIVFAYGDLADIESVSGISPGGGARAWLLDLTGELPAGALTTAAGERFVKTRQVDDLAIARAFFNEFGDVYDHLIVWLDFSQSLGGAFAYEFPLKNEVKGIGLPVFDQSAAAGSKARLRAFVQMGSLSRYPADPNREFLGSNTTLDVLGQEAGHRWLAFLQFRDADGNPSDALLGRDAAHWSFLHNSYASDMEGNEWREDGGGHFTSVAATSRYSTLDQYAIGLVSAGEVDPIWFISGGEDPARGPQVGVAEAGSRVDVAIDDILAVNGPRVPAVAKAPKAFTMAFVIVGEAGQFPSPESIAKVDGIRAAWQDYFAAAVDFRGTVDTTLQMKRRR